MKSILAKNSFYLILIAVSVLTMAASPAFGSAPRLIDFVPGVDDKSFGDFTQVGETIFFTCKSNSQDFEQLWKSDGTDAGTVMVKNISVYRPASVGGTLFFTRTDIEKGTDQLWKSDGTEAGTVMVKEFDPRVGLVMQLTAVGDTLFFAVTETWEEGLWKSDGTETGTVLVKDILPANTLGGWTPIGGTLYMKGPGDELWKSDGTEEGSVLVKDIAASLGSLPFSLTDVGGTLFFSADDRGSFGRELWKSDGTEVGTVMVKDIRPGEDNSGPRELVNVDGTLFFAAYEVTNGIELWKSDGTEAGTTMVRDIHPGGGHSDPEYLTNVDGILFFTASDGTNGTELWKSDGTEAGTVMVKDIDPTGDTYFTLFINVNGTLYFTADDDIHGLELWMSDGTEAGTVMVQDIRLGSYDSSPRSLTHVDGLLFFTAYDDINGRDLYVLNPLARTLTIDSTAGGGVSAPGEGVFEYQIDSVVDLLAIPDAGYRFLGWTGDTENLEDVDVPQTTVTVSGNCAVTAQFEAVPDLVVTDVWDEDGQVCYQIRNVGAADAPSGHSVNLVVDNTFAAADPIDTGLLPGERLTRCFASGAWNCSALDDAIRIEADAGQQMVESDETNNSRGEDWSCDTMPPLITSLPLVSQILQDSAEIIWMTDTSSNSVVLYGPAGGVYESQAEIQQQTDTHVVTLENLQPSTTYHYIVLSADESGNTVESQEGFFQTDPMSDDTPPEISGVQIIRGLGDMLYYTVTADVTDNIGVERVEFFLDDVLVCTDYTAPFECQLSPMYAEMSSETFFNEHSVEAVAYDFVGRGAALDILFEPPYECPEIRAHMEEPDPDEVYYIESTTVPYGVIIPLKVRASMPEMHCDRIDMSGLPGGTIRNFCEEEEHPVSEVRFFVNNELLSVESPLTLFDFGFDVDWDISVLSPGIYAIRVDVEGNDACIQTITNTFRIEQGEPELHASREVTRVGNYFQVDIIIENQGTIGVDFYQIKDFMMGFQPIAKNEADYNVSTICPPNDTHCGVYIDFPGGFSFTVEAHSSKRFTYLAVPVMYHPGQTVVYEIGLTQPIQLLDISERVLYEFDRPCFVTEEGYTLASEVDRALESADYLIVTNTSRLSSISTDNSANDKLLSSMAELAEYRNGILGKLIGSTTGPGDPNWVKDNIRTWGALMRGADGGAGRYLSNGGYLLLVGETEIIPSFTKTLKRWAGDISKDTVFCTDMPYGDMSGDTDPELSVGRIIGDTPAEMQLPIETSIQVAKGEPGFVFDRSDALLVAGDGHADQNGRDVEAFEECVDEVDEILSEEFIVTKIKHRIVDDSGGDVTALFKSNDENKDLFSFHGHCNPTVWGGVLETGDFGSADPVNFGDAKPVSIAFCCQAGQYEDDDDQSADLDNIAESFLQNDSPAYIGATVNSYRGQNYDAAIWFYDHWVNTSKPVGRTFRELKVHLDGYQGDFWSHEYNHYGDPKYRGVETVATARFSLQGATIPVPPSPYEIVIPDYEVKTVGSEDYVSIPEGNMVLEVDKPAVPFYIVRIEYPAGYAVQGVTLTERSGLVTTSGLNIPLSQMDIDADDGATASQSEGEEWWPSQDDVFDYRYETRHDGTSVLTITLFPFYYNTLTTDVKFYTNYIFDIQASSSGAGIALFKTDKENYDPGEVVNIELSLSGSEIPQEAIVEVVVIEEGTDDVVDGLLLRTLDGLTETSSLSFDWDSGALAPGSYYLEVNIRDSDGYLLSSRRKPLQLGTCAIAVQDFTAMLTTSTEVQTSLSFINDGSVETSGNSVVRILDENGNTVEEFRHNFSALQPAEVRQFMDVWDALGSTPGVYTAQAYVLYNSGSSGIQSHTIHICSYLNGDINGDGYIDLSDAVSGLQVLVGAGTNVSCGESDVNADGNIGLEEIVYILQEEADLR